MIKFLLFFCFLCSFNVVFSQEKVTTISCNPEVVQWSKNRSIQRMSRVLDTLNLPFIDDFSSTTVFPNQRNWTDYQVYINNVMAVNQPTKGVATFDGLNEQGLPYDISASGMSAPSDTLTSMPIRIGSKRASDSLYLSFFYQPEGLGEAPEIHDSLIVEFYNKYGFWVPVWGKEGSTLTEFKQALIGIIDSNYFHDGFQFRFRNYSSLTGFLDHWHIDYVRLDGNRLYNDTVYYDFAYAQNPESILKNYTQIPYLHFKTDSSQFLKSKHSIAYKTSGFGLQTISTTARFIEPRSKMLIKSQSITDNSTVNFRTYPPFSIPFSGADSFELDAIYDLGNNSSRIKSNDTITKRYLFYNQYAYDDGSAEYGYGLNTAGGKLAYQFVSVRPDSLRAIAINFVPIKTDVSKELFTLMVWKNIKSSTNALSDSLLYQSTFCKPKYQRFYNGFVIYELDSPIAISDTFYIGWQQNSDKILSVGLDRNDTANAHMYYNVTGTWQSSGIPGAWLMRPVLGKKTNFNVGISENSLKKVNVYPNPFMNHLTIEQDINDPIKHIELIDFTGKKVFETRYQNEVSFPYLENGIYFLRLFTSKGIIVTKLEQSH
jgi:hypothetical protein